MMEDKDKTKKQLLQDLGESRSEQARLKGIEQELRQTKEEFKVYQKELEDRIEARTRELSESNVMLKQEISDRKKAEIALSMSEEKYRSIFETSLAGIYRTSAEGGRFLMANQTLAEMLGYQSPEVLINEKLIIDLYANPELRPKIIERFRKYGEVTNLELEFLRADESHVIFLVSGVYNKEHDYIEGVVLDITERKQTEAALTKSEEQYRMLVETMSDGLIIRDKNGFLVFVNERFCRMMGYTRSELTGRLLSDFLDMANLKIVEREIRKRKKGSEDPYALTWTRKDGQKVYALVSPKPIFDQENIFQGSFAIITDITQRRLDEKKLVESEKKLRLLSTHVLKAQEKGRERISKELHDELGQDLTLLKYKIRLIEKNLNKGQDDLRTASLEALNQIDQVMDQVRLMSQELSPPILKYLGLTASLKRLVEEFSRYSRTRASIKLDDIDNLLANEAEINLYRIFKEALTNVGKHARARNISLTVKKQDRSILCSLEDDGRGFDIEKVRLVITPDIGLGLTTMEERTRMLGGKFDLSSQKGIGTKLSINIPIPLDDAKI
jgi:PAS domain S-box-containing protein